MSDAGRPAAAFEDVLEANRSHAQTYASPGPGKAGRGLAVLTCIDSRLDPLAMLGLSVGDAKVIRNAGARVTEDVLGTLAISAYLLDVTRVMVIVHSRCAVAGSTEADVHAAIRAAGGPDTRSLAVLTAEDQLSALRADVQRIRSWPYLPEIPIAGFRYDVDTGVIGFVC